MTTNRSLTRTSVFLAGLFVGAAAVATAQDESTERISRTIKVGREGALEVSNVSGDIVIQAGTGDEIQIEAVKRADGRRGSDARRQTEQVDVEINEIGQRVTVRALYRTHRSNRVSVDFTITAPPRTSITAKSVSGTVRVSSIKGELRAESVSGDVRLIDANGAQLAKSVSGNVEVTNVATDAYLEARTVSGEVSVRQVQARELNAESVSGGVTVEESTCGRASLGSVSGDIRFRGALAEGGRYEFKSHSGGVDLTFMTKTGFEFEGKTFSGEIHSDLPLTVTELRRGRLLRGVHGDGGAYVSATSFSGDIRVRGK